VSLTQEQSVAVKLQPEKSFRPLAAVPVTRLTSTESVHLIPLHPVESVCTDVLYSTTIWLTTGEIYFLPLSKFCAETRNTTVNESLLFSLHFFAPLVACDFQT